jgi:hypothetical protein
MLDLADEADSYEDQYEQEGTHLTPDGEAAVIRGDDLLTVREALDAAALLDEAPVEQLAKFRAVAHALDVTPDASHMSVYRRWRRTS